MAQLNDLVVTGDARIVGNLYNNSGMVAWGTCSTAAATAAKEIVVADPSWTLKVGNIIGVRFTNTNSASSCTLNVNGTGAKQIVYGATIPYTGSSQTVLGYAKSTVYYMYDGTYWVWLNRSQDDNWDTYTSAYCATAAGTAAKGASQTNYKLLAKSYTLLTIVNANTAAAALTLNINGQGAKPIYINGTISSSSNYTLPAGTYLVYYDGTNYYLRTDGKINGAGGCLVDQSSSQALTNKTYNGYTLAAACAKGVDTSMTVDSTSTNIPTTAAVASLVKSAGGTDTKNTAGSTNTSSKIFLIGATSQAANPQTYSHDTAYVGTDGCLYSGGAKVLTSHLTVDTALSSSSTNPVQNKVVNTALAGKQASLATQTAYSAKGSATKVPQITTNTLGQVTGITEVTITQPTVNNATLTIQKNGTNVATFTSNASSNVTANITFPTILSGTSVPTSSIGKNGDIYIYY